MAGRELETVETASFLDVFWGVPEAIAGERSVEVHEVAGAVCGTVRSLPGSRILNRVMGLGLASPATDADLDAIADAYGETAYVIALAPQAQPPDLAQRLAERGFEPDYAWAKFRRGLEPIPPFETDLRVERVGPALADAFGEIVAEAYGFPAFLASWVAALVARPGWSFFLALAGDEPAAAGALYVKDRVGWLGFAGTRPQYPAPRGPERPPRRAHSLGRGSDVARPAVAGARALLSGNEAIGRGAWEAGVRVAAGYPGTPSTEILESLAEHEEVDARWSPNEKVALDVALGTSLGGARALAAMKHVGLNVAADTFLTAAYTGVGAGLVVVSADDPGMHSSQNEQDNRLYARFAGVPLLEPADSREAKEFTKLVYEISEQFDTPVLLRATTRVCHSRAVVELEEPAEPGKPDFGVTPRSTSCSRASPGAGGQSSSSGSSGSRATRRRVPSPWSTSATRPSGWSPPASLTSTCGRCCRRRACSSSASATRCLWSGSAPSPPPSSGSSWWRSWSRSWRRRCGRPGSPRSGRRSFRAAAS